MSLFPSASSMSLKQKNKEGKEWLENKSFQESEAFRAQQIKSDNSNFVETSKDTLGAYYSSSDDDHTASDQHTSDHEAVDEKQEAGIVIDKSKDKNNLFFKKPYKVYIPRFHRGATTCMGLSPYWEIVFKENKKKRKVAVLDRYYHQDTSLKVDEGVTSTDEQFKLETEQLNIETREHPENVAAWMDLVKLQDKTGSKNLKMLAEKKIAILDKAIAINPSNVDLKLHRLKLCGSISEDTGRDWKDLVFRHPGSRMAWEAYIAHSKKGSSFAVKRTLKVYERCLQTWMAINDGSFKPKEPCPDVEDDMVSVFKDLVQFLLESGHTELCLMLLLLMIEVNLRTVDCKSVADVEGFYESGDPILGEPNSTGWKAWSIKNERGGWLSATAERRAAEDDDDELDLDADKPLSENWLLMEENRNLKNWFPWRSEEDCEDLGRKVPFDDLRGFIFFVSRTVNRLHLLKLLMCFFGAKLEHETECDYLLSQTCQLTHATSSASLPGDTSTMKLHCDDCCAFGILPRKDQHEFLCTVFEQLHKNCPQQFRAPAANMCLEYFVTRVKRLRGLKAMKQELKSTHKEAKNLAKIFLRAAPMNFLLWSKLARVESGAGKREDCRKIFNNALCMCKAQPDAMLLCNNFAEEMYDADPDAVKLVLSALGDDLQFADYLQSKKQVSGVVLLRAARNMERICEDLSCLYQQAELGDVLELSTFANAVCCYAYYLRLTSDSSISTALQVYIDVMRRQKAAGSSQALVDLKHIHRLKLKLIRSDAERHNFYRNSVLSALDDYPRDPRFAAELCEVEVGSSILSVARRLFGSLETTTHSFFAVYFELLRQKQDPRDPSSSAATQRAPPRVLNLLERAVTKHDTCVFLWRLFVRLNPDPTSVLLRAAIHCPWSKAIACDTIRRDSDGLDKVLKFMKDNGIRLRTPVEEVKLLMTL